MKIEEKTQFILDVMAFLPIDKWDGRIAPNDDWSYAQKKNNITFYLYPPADHPGDKPHLTVIFNEGSTDEIKRTFYHYADPKGQMEELWNRLITYTAEKQEEEMDRGINIIYENLLDAVETEINCKNMTHEDYIKTDNWFAWLPVKTTNVGWVWCKVVNRTIDERPEVYLGLLPEYSYCSQQIDIRNNRQ